MSLDAMKLALEALETVTVDVKTTPNAYEASRQAITALRAAIKEAQEPVAWTTMPDDEDWLFISGTSDPNGMLDGKWNPLYTAPRQWQGLTDEELRQAYCEVSGKEWCLGGLANAHTFYDALETKLKEKNNG